MIVIAPMPISTRARQFWRPWVVTATTALPASAEAGRRLAQYGPNALKAEAPIPAWRKFLAQFQDVLIGLLLGGFAMGLAERRPPRLARCPALRVASTDVHGVR
ncbi:MAG: cation-transporting P-type ATPase [Oscillochloridaceae bacterium umkhey_bin13]